MPKAPSPLLGFNNNVKHRGRVFHIQTEDSGIRYPHVITHLFADGGRILNSTKTSYAEHVGATNLAETVRAMMKDQHKAMFIALRDGKFDHLLEDAAAEGSAPANASGTAQGQAGSSSSADRAKEASTETASTTATSSPSGRPAATRPHDSSTSQPPAAASSRGTAQQDDLEHAAAAAQTGSPAVPAAKRAASPPTDVPATSSRGAQASSGRYSASRPAAMFASSRPSEAGSVFGEDMISSKSLDEVILSFLSEEFGSTTDGEEKPKPKK